LNIPSKKGRPEMTGTVLITGASGLLGKALVGEFASHRMVVLGQYHRHPGPSSSRISWLPADFSTPEGVERFFRSHQDVLTSCTHLVNNYGPLIPARTAALTSDDLYFHFHHNVGVACSLIHFLVQNARLESVVNIGFYELALDRRYFDILPYAIAKAGLLMVTRSLAGEFPDMLFNMVSPATLTGAMIPHGTATPLSPEFVAGKIFRVATGSASGRHFRLKAR
jgi:NAD(P)-dependent dehydrogenase (short-subunit alcohol dehydrogenase family)